MSAYSSTHFRMCLQMTCSLTAGYVRLDWAMNSLDGLWVSSSYQCTAIWASVVSATVVAAFESVMKLPPFASEEDRPRSGGLESLSREPRPRPGIAGCSAPGSTSSPLRALRLPSPDNAYTGLAPGAR